MSKRITNHKIRRDAGVERPERQCAHRKWIGTRTYNSWNGMKQRATNLNSAVADRYIGRGIGICKRWLHFPNFLADMGECPEGLTIERRNNNKGYFPSNCYWGTRKEQSNNRRNNRLITYQGRTQTLAQWADELKLSWDMLHNRVLREWPIEELFLPPVTPKQRIERMRKNGTLRRGKDSHAYKHGRYAQKETNNG